VRRYNFGAIAEVIDLGSRATVVGVTRGGARARGAEAGKVCSTAQTAANVMRYPTAVLV